MIFMYIFVHKSLKYDMDDQLYNSEDDGEYGDDEKEDTIRRV